MPIRNFWKDTIVMCPPLMAVWVFRVPISLTIMQQVCFFFFWFTLLKEDILTCFASLFRLHSHLWVPGLRLQRNECLQSFPEQHREWMEQEVPPMRHRLLQSSWNLQQQCLYNRGIRHCCAFGQGSKLNLWSDDGAKQYFNYLLIVHYLFELKIKSFKITNNGILS